MAELAIFAGGHKAAPVGQPAGGRNELCVFGDGGLDLPWLEQTKMVGWVSYQSFLSVTQACNPRPHLDVPKPDLLFGRRHELPAVGRPADV